MYKNSKDNLYMSNFDSRSRKHFDPYILQIPRYEATWSAVNIMPSGTISDELQWSCHQELAIKNDTVLSYIDIDPNALKPLL